MEQNKHNAEGPTLINEIRKIKVTKNERNEVMIDNPTDLSVISCDKKRAVISIDQTCCAVYFTDEEKAKKEFQALQMGTALGITPNVYGQRKTYVIMEPINAPTLGDYLQKHSITKDLTQKILQLLHNFEKAGFTRMDQRPEYIFLMPDGSLKVVNVYRHTNLPSKLLPKRIIKSMGKQVSLFLKHVKKIDPTMYQKWVKDPDFHLTLQKTKIGNVH